MGSQKDSRRKANRYQTDAKGKQKVREQKDETAKIMNDL